MPESLDRQGTLALPLKHIPFVLLDLETTGLDATAGDRICEIALLRWQNREIVGRFETLVNPDRDVSPGAHMVHGIGSDELDHAPLFADVADAFLREVEGAVIVAHNVPFDLHFVDSELARLDRPPLNNIPLDTLTLARCFLAHDRYNLGALSRDLGFDRPAHRAMSDVRALLALFEHLLNRLEMLGVQSLGDLVRAQRGLLPGAPEPEAPALIAEALRNGPRLRIAYRSRGGEAISREILPLEFQVARGLPRLMAYCYLRNGQRTFYLDRIAELAHASSEVEEQPALGG